MKDTESYQSAKRRVEAKMGFYIHLSVYVAVMVLLVFINLASSAQTIWFHWPMLGWGCAVAIHALAAFVFPGRFAVTEDKIQKEMEKARHPPRG